MKFEEEIIRYATIIKSLLKSKKVKIVSHIDADGISSASIIAKVLMREGVNFELRLVKQLIAEEIQELDDGSDGLFIFSDCGSGQLSLLKNIFEKTQVLVLDHHDPEHVVHPNLFHLNPLAFGQEEISASMICYLFAKAVNIINTDLIDLAIVGAVGDEQDNGWKFSGTARKILQEAEVLGKVSVMEGLRLYGRNSRPLHKVLEYSFDLAIPNITGSESQAVQLLSELGIGLKSGQEWKRLKDLTPEEEKTLASAIIKERLKSESDPADVFGEIYLLVGRPEEVQDAREFATILNSCGRTSNWDIGIGLCLGSIGSIEASWDVLNGYRKSISNSLNFIRNDEGAILATGFATYILGENRIPDTLIGTVASIALNSNIVNPEKPVFGFVQTDGEKVKISARAPRKMDLNIGQIMREVTKILGGEGGGHEFAAGGLVSRGSINKFISLCDKILEEKVYKNG